MKAETRVGIFVVTAIGIFIYLSVNIGALRLDRAQYNIYKTYFDDTGGLDIKSPVKIAGVEVGWVSDINLLPDGKAEILLRVSKNIKLAKNSYAMISQEGLIGTKTLVLDAGDPSTGTLLPGSILSMPGKSPATVSDLLDQFKDIASNIQDIAYSFRSVFATAQGERDMKDALSGIAQASSRMSDFADVLNKTIRRNEENINSMLLNFKNVGHHLDDAVPAIQKDANKLTLAFADDTLPKLSDASIKVGNAFETIDDTAVQARDTFKEAEQVAEKINAGKGLIGKLINEDETYEDIKKTIRGLKDYVATAQSLVIDVDMHSETLCARDWNSKGYFEAKIRPTDDYFYQIQIVGDERGTYKRENHIREWRDNDGQLIDPETKEYPNDTYGRSQKSHDELEFSKTYYNITQTKNDIMFGFQFGKRFNRLALRIGMFENSFGFACDYFVPVQSDKFHWITSLEAFDFKGTKREDYGFKYSRPYIRWVNKVFLMRNMYTSFGFDDMLGRTTSGPFLGGGVRFNDDDLKYLLSMIPMGKGKS